MVFIQHWMVLTFVKHILTDDFRVFCVIIPQQCYDTVISQPKPSSAGAHMRRRDTFHNQTCDPPSGSRHQAAPVHHDSPPPVRQRRRGRVALCSHSGAPSGRPELPGGHWRRGVPGRAGLPALARPLHVPRAPAERLHLCVLWKHLVNSSILLLLLLVSGCIVAVVLIVFHSVAQTTALF